MTDIFDQLMNEQAERQAAREEAVSQRSPASEALLTLEEKMEAAKALANHKLSVKTDGYMSRQKS